MNRSHVIILLLFFVAFTIILDSTMSRGSVPIDIEKVIVKAKIGDVIHCKINGSPAQAFVLTNDVNTKTGLMYGYFVTRSAVTNQQDGLATLVLTKRCDSINIVPRQLSAQFIGSFLLNGPPTK